MDLSDPDYPHGGAMGYKYGCRKTYGPPCPATPTCADFVADRQARYRKRRQHTHVTEGRHTTYVLKRLAETLGVISDTELAQITGVPRRRIMGMADGTHPSCQTVLIAEQTAAALDAAWALHVHGSDITQITQHGKVSSYTDLWCRCEDCTSASTRARKRHAAGIGVDPDRVVVAADTIPAHIDVLYRAAGEDWEALGRVVGLTGTWLRRLWSSKTPARMHAKTHRDLLKHTAESVAAECRNHSVPATRAYWLIGTMTALGYPIGWINHKAGLAFTRHNRREGRILRYVEEVLERVHAEVGDTPASTAHGVTEWQMSYAKGYARNRGFHPPAAYDDQMNLILRAIPNHPWSMLDDRAAVLVTGAYLGGQGVGTGEIARRLGVTRSMIQKDSGRVWHYTYDMGCRLDPVASCPRIREVSQVFHAWEAGEIGPVTAALMLGQPFKKVDAGQSDHPELLEWRHAQEAAAA